MNTRVFFYPDPNKEHSAHQRSRNPLQKKVVWEDLLIKNFGLFILVMKHRVSLSFFFYILSAFPVPKLRLGTE